MKVTVATQPKLDYSKHRGGRPNENPACKTIDWNNSSDRKWLMNHMHWAMNNSHEVRLVPNESQLRGLPVRAVVLDDPESN